MKLSVILAVSLLATVWLVEAADPQNTTGAVKIQAAPGKTAIKNIGLQEFEKLRSEKTNVVLDVRTAKEFNAGHVPGAINVDVNSPDFDKRVAALDPSKTYLVHCGSGVRSARACTKLGTMNFQQLYDFKDGFKGWEKAGHKPVK